ncbi:MAG: FAD binding domain-containing protein [Giesbergeria sp.]
MWHEYINAISIEQVIQILGDKKERARVVTGGTDLILELERGVRKGIETLVDVTRIPKLNQITIDEDDVIHLGALVTHNDCAGSKLIRARAYPLARAAWEVGAPQIRNRGTVSRQPHHSLARQRYHHPHDGARRKRDVNLNPRTTHNSIK